MLPADCDIDDAAAASTAKDKPLSINSLLRIARDQEAAASRESAASAAAELGDIDDCDLRVGDFRDVLADVSDLDAIITDPPYPAEYLPLLDDLAALALRALKPDGVLAVLFGQTHLPEVYERLAAGPPYRWTMAYMTPGSGYASHPRRVQSNWKPVLIYGGGPRFGDVVTTAGDDKRHHEWGQDFSAFSEIVTRLTKAGDLVCDPFLGGGTTAKACMVNNRRFVGCDIDEKNVAITKGRVSAD